MRQAIDFCAFQDVLDPIFHSRDDAYPAGCAEHSEIYQFLSKLDKLHTSRPSPLEPSHEAKEAAEKLGISAAYDPRFRVNASILVDPKRMKKGLRAVQKKADELSAATGVILTADEVIKQYARLLPFYEDFYQKRHIAKLMKLEQDRAALPIAAFQSQIVDAVRTHQAVVIAGNTGCGKSTQVPQYLVNAGFKNVVCTQPRRISAISLCRRVSFETMNVFGSDVAYQVRFNSTVSSSTRVVFMTEGILLRIMASHPQLTQYDVVIVDEVHERHLNTDFLLALLRALLIQRPEFRVVLMSATINQQMYSDYFGGAPVIQVPGRLYPVELEYIPPPKQEKNQAERSKPGPKHGKSGNSNSQPIDPAPYLRLLQRIDSEYPSSNRGDMLVFVAGMSDITRLRDALQPYAQQTQRWIILPLHSALPLKDQDKVFDVAPQGARKCIISTNIAETSVTIDGIRFVVDSGRAKEMLHDVTSGSGTLQEGWISQASAEQRKGRAGRTGPGKCFRMYSKEHFGRMMAFSLPEIRRARLESVVLQIKSLAGSSMDPRCFGFIEPPPEDALEGAITTLRQVGALAKSEELTALGAVLSALPVEVHVGKMLVLGALLNILDPLLTVAAALTVQSPFMRIPDDAGPGIRDRRRELMSPHGDALTLVHTFEAWLSMKAEGRSSTAKWCNRRGLQEQRLYELSKLKRQFQDLLEETGLVHLSGMEGTRKRKRTAGHERRRLMELQRMQEHKRTKRVLMAPGEALEEEEDEKQDQDTDDEEVEDEEDELDIDDLEFRLRSRREHVFANAGRPFSHSDIGLLKSILACSLYPRVAVPDINNHQRREQDAKFHTAYLSDCVLHPASCLTGNATSFSSQEVLMYTELLETTREYICGNTPCRVVPLLLLAALHVDTNAQATSMLLDGWLLVRFHDETGPLVLRRVVQLRRALDTLLAQRLKKVRLPHLPSPEAFAAASVCAPNHMTGDDEDPVPPLRLLLHHDLLSGVSLSEEAVAAELAASVDWPIRYSVEHLTGQKVTAQYIIKGDSQNMTKDLRGVPKQKAGFQVTSWLRVGSLKRFTGERSLHVLQPHLRRHWLCPGCHSPMLGNAEEIQAHVNSCQRALQLPQTVLEEQGYQDGAAAVKLDSTTATTANPNNEQTTNDAADGGPGGAGPGLNEPAGPPLIEGTDLTRQGEEPIQLLASAEHLEAVAGELGLNDPVLLDKLSVQGVRWVRRVPGSERYTAGRKQEAGVDEPDSSMRRAVGEAGADPDGGFRHGQGEVRQGAGVKEMQDEGDGAGASVERGRQERGQAAAAAPPSAREYVCHVCGLEARLTPIQILQHKRSHG